MELSTAYSENSELRYFTGQIYANKLTLYHKQYNNS